MVKVVYFNQWFSSIANVIDDLKKKHGNRIKIIASSKNKDHAYKDSVDVFIVEDWEETDDKEESMQNYIDWVLNLCETYHVDYFFVKKHAKYIRKNSMELYMRGVFLISEDLETLGLMDSKADVYDRLIEDKVLSKYIPEYYIFSDTWNAKTFVKHSLDNEEKICLKLDTDEGGASFRMISNEAVNFESLYKFRINTLNYSDALDLIDSADGKIDKILFMELLDNPEISVDCYNSKKGFIAICRCKEGGRREKIYYSKRIANICKRICDELHLRFPFNVQFRYKAGSDKSKTSNLRLLEINPRMSGGLYYEVLHGMNIAEVCLLDMMNMPELYDINKFKDFKPKYVGHVEKPIKLS